MQTTQTSWNERRGVVLAAADITVIRNSWVLPRGWRALSAARDLPPLPLV
jgi:hypothetical protein